MRTGTRRADPVATRLDPCGGNLEDDFELQMRMAIAMSKEEAERAESGTSLRVSSQ